MRERVYLNDRVNVQDTEMHPFVVNGEVRYRLTIRFGLGCRSDFVFDEAGLTAHVKQIASTAHVAAGLIMKEVS